MCGPLISEGHHVRVFCRQGAHHVRSFSDRVERIEGDFLNPDDVSKALQDCELVIHLVSTTIPKTSNDNLVYDIETNVAATIRMLREAVRSSVRKVIFISSGGTVYGIPEITPIPETHRTEPICGYGIGKIAIEKYLALFQHHYGLSYTVFRLSNPYGIYQNPDKRQGVITVFLNRILNGEYLEIWGDGTVTRDYIYIDDVVDAMISMLEYNGDERVFNLGSGKGYSLNEIVETIRDITDLSIKVKYLESRPVDVPINVLDISRIQAAVGWYPKTSLPDGIKKLLRALG